jgi:hypothetical protein
LKNHHGNTKYQTNCLIFEINSYTFKVATTKFSWKFTMFQESFHMFKAFNKNMWTNGFFVSKVHFPYEMFTKSFQFFVNFNIFHKKGSMCSKHSRKKYKYPFKFWYSNILKHYYSFEFVIIVQSKAVDLTIMQGLMQKKFDFLWCHIWPQIWYSVWNVVWKMEYKPIKNSHMENVVLERTLTLAQLVPFFMLSPKCRKHSPCCHLR